MADNVTLPGTGVVIAADDISSVWYQRVKLQASAADSVEELSKAEDAAHSSGHHGIMALAVRQDSLAALAGTTGDYIPLTTDLNGLLNVNAGGATAVVNGTFTRPSDTTAYAAGDAATNSTSAPVKITFASVVRVAAGSGTIISAVLIDSANQATKGSFELWLFDTSVTPDNDNAVFTPTDAELATLIGIIPFSASYVGDATSGAGGNAVYPAPGLNLPFKCTGSLVDIYGLLVVRNSFTPVSAEVFTIRLTILQD